MPDFLRILLVSRCDIFYPFEMKTSADNIRSPRERRQAFNFRLLILFILLAGYYFLGVKHHAGPDSGTYFDTTSAQTEQLLPGESFSVATFNIHRGKGMDGKRDINRTAEVLDDLDFVGLNEVGGVTLTRQYNQAKILGDKLEMPWLFAPTERLWGHDDFGNAVLSKLPVVSWQRIPIKSKSGLAKRNVVLVKVAHPNGTINFLVTHVANKTDDPEQLRVIAELFMSLDEPAILMGDFNHTFNTPAMQELTSRPGVKSAAAVDYKNDKGQILIDWMLYRGLDCIETEVIDRFVSDHPTIRAEFIWPGDSEENRSEQHDD